MQMHRMTIVLLGVVLCLSTAILQAETAGFQVIVNADNPQSSIGKEELARLFLKQSTRWSDGTEVVPVDLHPKSPVRVAFSQAIHGRDVSAIKNFWQRQIFSGRGVPPVETTLDSDVMDFVRSHPGGVGYVAAETAIGEGLKVLEVVQ